MKTATKTAIKPHKDCINCGESNDPRDIDDNGMCTECFEGEMDGFYDQHNWMLEYR